MRSRHPLESGVVAGDYTLRRPDGRLQCTLCPRKCTMRQGQRGFCYVRRAGEDSVELTSYGRASGFCIDPIEKKPLNHFLPGSSVLSFGTAGCNLGCRFCQNWSISKAATHDRLQDFASPEAIAQAAVARGCSSVAFTYNDPVIFAEYAIDTAQAARAVGVAAVAVTAGYITAEARPSFFEHLDAANIDLKAFTPEFYRRSCLGELQPVLDTLSYVRNHTDVWLEITTLLIPGRNDSDEELAALCRWVVNELGPDVPLHFTAFHPDFKEGDLPPTPPATLTRARQIARGAGIHHVYTGNVRDAAGQSTYCGACGELLIERDGYRIGHFGLVGDGACGGCGARLPGRFERAAGNWGARRLPMVIG